MTERQSPLVTGPQPAPERQGPADHRGEDQRPIGRILEAMGVIGASDALLGRYEQELGDRRRLGEILRAQGLATDDQITEAVEIQRAGSGARLASDIGEGAPSVGAGLRGSAASPRRRRNLQAVAMFVLAATGVTAIAVMWGGGANWYGITALAWLSLKLTGSVLYRPASGRPPVRCRAAAVVAFYNEDPDTFVRCLRSVLAQSRMPDQIWVIDDGSASPECWHLAEELLSGCPNAVVIRHPVNRGKRHAQGIAFARTDCDVVMTIDSDTVLDPGALSEGLLPFRDPSVQAVTGNVRALNFRTNLLTRLIDLRYASAFLFERASYSVVGSVVCCCGSLSLLRTGVVRRNLDDFVGQTFLGVPVQYGDDRRLTQYALAEGRVVLQDTAVAYTVVPEKLGHFRRQQLRWNRSFFRESWWAIRRFGPRRGPSGSAWWSWRGGWRSRRA